MYISIFQIAGVPERSKGQGLGVLIGLDKTNRTSELAALTLRDPVT